MTQQQCDCASHGKMNARDKFLHWLLPKFFDYRDIIVGGELYLRRYYLKGRGTKSQWFLHNIRLPDPGRDFHCHQWGFKTRVLLGSYIEEMPAQENPIGRILKPLLTGDTQEVPAVHTHRIFGVHPDTCWTLVHTGPAEREWGFLVIGKTGLRSWVHWRDYLGDRTSDHPEDRVAN